MSKLKKKLTTSLEDYLEAILSLEQTGRVARVRDIAKLINVGMSSVTAALKALSSRKLVNYQPYQVITLTRAGKDAAEEVSRRHHVIQRFLTDVLELDADIADATACRMEHAVDCDFLQRLNAFMEFISRCPRTGRDWIEKFEKNCSQGTDTDQCRDCLMETVKSFEESKTFEEDRL